jgi:fumarylacetoacetase
MRLDHTHDKAARSWLDSANDVDSHFPLQNLPYAIFRRRTGNENFRAGIALGDQIIDVTKLLREKQLPGQAEAAAVACTASTLNAFFAMGHETWRALRHAVFDLFSASGNADRETLVACLVPQSDAEYGLPAKIGDYTDFYTSIDHARNVARLLRGNGSVSPNFHWMPIAYHGRSSSIGLSGQTVRRPRGQIIPAGRTTPELAPSARLDYELELGIFIGVGNEQGVPIPIDRAEDHVFGVCLLNDWSARDIQAWETPPLGPFQAKNFATTISPWIVTLDALAPFRCPWSRSSEDPQVLAYLDGAGNRQSGAIDIQLQVSLETKSRGGNSKAVRVSHTSFRHQYWTLAQMVAHHTVGGCNLGSGDLLGSGTISGPEATEAGALIELTAGGKKPLSLPDGNNRGFLEDGDVVVMTGWCERDGFARIGFGENRGEIVPALGT